MSEKEKRQITDNDVKRKAVKHVILYMKKKADGSFTGKEQLMQWIEEMTLLLADEEKFIPADYHAMRKRLNGIVESITEHDRRVSLRNSWLSLGKALDRRAKP